MLSSTLDRVDRAISAGAEELLRGQRPDGAFTDAPPASTLGTAGAITALHTADPDGHADLVARGAAWLRAQQRPDGGWGGVVGAGSEPVATSVVTAALRITSATDSTEAVQSGRRRLAAFGGVAAVTDRAVNHLCRQFLALAGLPEAGRLRRLPLEIVLFDDVRRQRISFRTAPFVALALLQTKTMPPGRIRQALQRRAVPQALRLLDAIDAHEGRTGVFSEDPWPAALVCLGLAHAGLAPHLVDSTAGFLRRAVRPDGSWDAVTNLDLTRSAFATTGLIAAGYAADPRLAATRDLFHRCQQQEPFPVFGVPAGGWSYNGARGWPVTLESAEIVTALAGLPGHADDPVLRRGVEWLVDRQDSRGSWSLWVRDTKLANDGPCPGITSQGIVALIDAGHDTGSAPVAAALRWLHTAARPDGSYENLWYRDHTSGTAMVLDALAHAGQAGHPTAVRARDWLLRTRCADGSWGPGDGTAGTVEETAWAVHALLAAGIPADDEAVGAGVAWLLAAQQPDGSWPASRVCAYIRHHMHYPNGAITRGLALRALAAWRTHSGGTT
ncbi:prenyltransferase/squalene oxidase repeat-containing protein [Micromonospora echinofusca]|uniref:Prenyltransferase n=1 Tax=Micromonospora echinofusca TaxID=47858 RepID=A0ABS3VS26_MICEH|nr:prenyltransferase/squalene oxidase repeat-containing protein [Micromonospora echinofusca]MBO4207339.1 prenyltransferase [Micromonospora echinofusca]